MITRRRFVELCSAAGATAAMGLGQPGDRFRVGIAGSPWKDADVAWHDAAELGFHYIEAFNEATQPYWDEPEKLKEKLDRLGLLGFVSISNGPPMNMHFEDAAQAEQVIEDHVKLGLWSNKWFGIDHLKANLFRPRRPEGPSHQELAQMAKTMNAIGERLSDVGMKLAPHPHLWSTLLTRAEIGQIMEITNPKWVGLVVDTGHMTMAGNDPMELTKTYLDRIVEFHFKDTGKENRGGHVVGPVPDERHYTEHGHRIFYELGEGGVDFPGIVEVLRKNNWNRWITLELDSTDTTPLDSAIVSKRYMQRQLHLTL